MGSISTGGSRNPVTPNIEAINYYWVLDRPLTSQLASLEEAHYSIFLCKND